MKRLLLLISAATLPPTLGCPLDELLTHVHEVSVAISRALTASALDQIDRKIAFIASAFPFVDTTEYHCARLQKALLQKRCRLIAFYERPLGDDSQYEDDIQ